jgi:hypothetical protein
MREQAAREAEARANEAEQDALARNPVINEHSDMQARRSSVIWGARMLEVGRTDGKGHLNRLRLWALSSTRTAHIDHRRIPC